MDKDELRELLEDRDFITGIYNYCDRWCERCPFSSRCLVYATERADTAFDDPETHDINNAKFWQKLESVFRETREMIREWAQEAGIDLEEIDTEAAMKEHQQEEDNARQHHLSVSGQDYAMAVRRWFEEELALEQEVHNDTTGRPERLEENSQLTDAIEVIRWYQFFIAAKMFRALIGADDYSRIVPEGSDDIFAGMDLDLDGDSDDEALDEAAGSDSDGSAKIALIAIDRSLSAWRVLQHALPEKADTIMPMLVELEKLRRAGERAFPRARDFIRPGFDEVSSDFVS